MNTERCYQLPSRATVESIAVGDLALDYAGRMARVTDISACREDVEGRLFCCYYTEMGPGSNCSMSIKEGELTRTTALSFRHTSAELDVIERRMRDGGMTLVRGEIR